MKSTHSSTRLFRFSALSTLALCIGCGGGVEVRGKISDETGTQAQGLSSVPSASSLGGSGTVSAASRVEAHVVTQNGELELVGDANVTASGEYTVTVPEGSEVLVISALDASGKVLASAILEGTDTASTYSAPPMDGETSLETQVFVRLRAVAGESANAVDVRARLTQSIAAEVAASRDDGDKLAKRIDAIVDGIRAAQEAEVKAYARGGVQISQKELFELKKEAGLALSASLASGKSSADAYAEFFAAIATRLEERGLDAKKRAEGERESSASFRAVVKAKLDADPLAELTARAAASAEARASAAALEAVLAAASASADAQAKATTAAQTLRTQVSAATSAAAAAEAFAAFSASIATGSNVSSTVLGTTVGANVATEVTISAAVTATVTAGAALETALDATVSAGASVDPMAVAAAVSEAYATYTSAVRAQATVLAALGAGATPTVELLLIAEGSFRFR